MKRKGSRIERELIDMLWANNYAAVRSPGSGVSSHPVPDIIAGNGKRFMVFEVKARSNLPIYIQNQRIDELLYFSRKFGAEAFIAVKIPRKKWKFIKIDQLKRTKRGYKVDDDVFHNGMNFDEVIGQKFQQKLIF